MRQPASAVSPVVAVILVVAVAVVLSAGVFVVVSDMAASSTDSAGATGSAGVKAESGNGSVTLRVISSDGELTYRVGDSDERPLGSTGAVETLVEDEDYNQGDTIVVLNDGEVVQTIRTAVSSGGTSGPTAPSTGLVAHWAFDGDASDETGAYDATPHGTPNFVTDADRGQVVNLDGSGDYFSAGTTSSFNFIHNDHTFTVAAWVQPHGTSEYWWLGTSEAADASVGFDTALFRDGTQNAIRFDLRDGSGNDYAFFTSPDGTLSATEWHHVVFTGDGDTLKIYHNGTEVASTAAPTQTSSDASAAFGLGAVAGYGSETLDGELDDVRVYERGLTADEVADLYNATE